MPLLKTIPHSSQAPKAMVRWILPHAMQETREKWRSGGEEPDLNLALGGLNYKFDLEVRKFQPQKMRLLHQALTVSTDKYR